MKRMPKIHLAKININQTAYGCPEINFLQKNIAGNFWYKRIVIIKMEDKILSRKKYLIMYVLKILESNTDRNHPMTQTEIAEWLNDVMPCDRKTVGRNIEALIEMGYPIVKTQKGCYLGGKKFGTEEIAFILGAIRGDTVCELSSEKRVDLAERLLPILTRIYRFDEN